MNGELNKLFQACVDKWGAELQQVKAIEEMSELQKELCKDLIGEGDRMNIAEELADVALMIAQIRYQMGLQEEYEMWFKRKLERLQNILQEE